jgi:hypothetical protein
MQHPTSSSDARPMSPALREALVEALARAIVRRLTAAGVIEAPWVDVGADVNTTSDATRRPAADAVCGCRDP